MIIKCDEETKLHRFVCSKCLLLLFLDKIKYLPESNIGIDKNIEV